MKVRKQHSTVKSRGPDRHPIENEIDLEDWVTFSSLPGQPGAVLLSDRKGGFQFRFAFSLDGLHPTLSEEQFKSQVSFFEAGLKAFPEGEAMIIEQTVGPSNQGRLAYYQRLADSAPSDLFASMVASAASPSEYLVALSPEDKATLARSKYKQKRIVIYVTATAGRYANVKDRTEAVLSKAIDWGKGLWGRFTEQKYVDSPERIKKMFRDAQALYEDWSNIITSQMNLVVQPVSMTEMVLMQWTEFNGDRPMPPVPQHIEWTGQEVLYKMSDDIHVSSWLFSSQGRVPRAHRNFVVRKDGRGRPRYYGAVSLRNRPGGWATATDMLKYLYTKPEGLHEYKLVVTITPASSALTERSVELLQRQAKDAIRAADKRGLPSTRSEALQRDADNAASRLYSGDISLKMSLCYVVVADDSKALDMGCRRLQSRFTLPASMEIEEDYTYQTWMQCHPQLSIDWPLFTPYNRTRAFHASNMSAFFPLVKVTSPDAEGLEFITEDEGTLFYLDIAKIHRHILFLATTRAGKSVLFAQILLLAMCSGIPMVVVDYPRESGDSTFGPITELAREHGAYLNIAEESNNVFELPDLSQFDEDEQNNRLVEVKDYVLDILMIVVFGADDGVVDRERRTARSILGNLLIRFYDDPEISKRFTAAINAPIGSPSWRNVPTLKDFSRLCNKRTLQTILDDEELSSEHIQLVNELRLRFEAFMETTVGRSMSQPTSIPHDAKLLVFAFKGVRDNNDVAILMASASAAAMRRTLASPTSILFLDEASILSKFPALMGQVAKIAANGAKSGIRLMMALQTPASIASSKYAADIFANMSTRIIGRVDEADAKSYCGNLSIPESVIATNCSKAFYPNRAELYSRWLIVDRGQYTYGRSYAPPLLLAAVANNPDEEEAKRAFLDHYDDETTALREFAKELILSSQENRPIQYPTEQRRILHAVS
ncbi:MAG: hypothetical protein AAGE59_19735 [Cyanobacteria bacterium P01_F01_bin.86]